MSALVFLDLLANLDAKAAYERDVRMAIRELLLSLSFHAFEHLVKELLIRLGYSDVRLLGRTHFRQYTRHGGIDMEAFAAVGLSNAQVVLQIKQYRRPVSRRFIDELSGVILRTGAREGIVITTSDFSEVAKTAAKSHRLMPIRLIDGEELPRLLIAHQLSVTCHEQIGARLSRPAAVADDFPPGGSDRRRRRWIGMLGRRQERRPCLGVDTGPRPGDGPHLDAVRSSAPKKGRRLATKRRFDRSRGAAPDYSNRDPSRGPRQRCRLCIRAAESNHERSNVTRGQG